MSWPSDGKPRFAVTLTEGYAIRAGKGTGGNNATNLSATVIDRAHCCRVVQEWKTEALLGGRWSRERRREFVIEEAETRVRQLNTFDERYAR